MPKVQKNIPSMLYVEGCKLKDFMQQQQQQQQRQWTGKEDKWRWERVSPNQKGIDVEKIDWSSQNLFLEGKIVFQRSISTVFIWFGFIKLEQISGYNPASKKCQMYTKIIILKLFVRFFQNPWYTF